MKYPFLLLVVSFVSLSMVWLRLSRKAYQKETNQVSGVVAVEVYESLVWVNHQQQYVICLW